MRLYEYIKNSVKYAISPNYTKQSAKNDLFKILSNLYKDRYEFDPIVYVTDSILPFNIVFVYCEEKIIDKKFIYIDRPTIILELYEDLLKEDIKYISTYITKIVSMILDVLNNYTKSFKTYNPLSGYPIAKMISIDIITDILDISNEEVYELYNDISKKYIDLLLDYGTSSLFDLLGIEVLVNKDE